MPDNVHANLQDLEQLQRTIAQSEREIREALNKARQALERADWHDARRVAFEAKFKDVQSKGNHFATDLAALGPEVSRVINDLKQFLQRR